MVLTGQGDVRQQDVPLPMWVLPVCLVLAAVACVLVLRLTIAVMSQEPATPTPATAPAAP
jgi:hypothetical protein